MPATSFIIEDGSINMDDSDLFNYFLNEDLATYDESSLSPSSSDSPQTSPPQLLPDSPDLIGTQVSSLLFDQALYEKNGTMQVKEELSGFGTGESTSNSTSTTGTAPSSRKRALKDSAVALSRDELLKLSSKGLDNYAQTVASARPLTQDEERQLKRQRRLIKNRESAQLSRMRKKIYIEELERKVSHLASENDNLTKQVMSISTDKRKLEEEVAYLQSIIRQSPSLNNLVLNKPMTKLNSSSKNVKTAGICLLIVLFSFGLLFNITSPDLPFSKRAKDERGLAASRMIKSVKEEKMEIPQKLPELPREEIVSSQVVEKNVEKKQQQQQQVVVPEGNSLKRKKITIADEPKKDLVPIDSSHIRYVKNNSLEVIQSHSLSRPDTNYIYCSEAHQVRSTSSAGSNGEPQNIALLIPSSVLNGTSDPRMDNSLLEVSCQVLNLHLWPMGSAVNNNP